MTWLERLKLDLESDGATVEFREHPYGLTVTSYEGRGADEVPVVELAFTETELNRHLSDMRSSAKGVFPGTEPMLAAYQFVFVHIMESVDTTRHKRLWLQIIGDELEAAPVPYLERDYPVAESSPDRSGDGEYVWMAYPPEGHQEEQARASRRE